MRLLELIEPAVRQRNALSDHRIPGFFAGQNFSQTGLRRQRASVFVEPLEHLPEEHIPGDRLPDEQDVVAGEKRSKSSRAACRLWWLHSFLLRFTNCRYYNTPFSFPPAERATRRARHDGQDEQDGHDRQDGSLLRVSGSGGASGEASHTEPAMRAERCEPAERSQRRMIILATRTLSPLRSDQGVK